MNYKGEVGEIMQSCIMMQNSEVNVSDWSRRSGGSHIWQCFILFFAACCSSLLMFSPIQIYFSPVKYLKGVKNRCFSTLLIASHELFNLYQLLIDAKWCSHCWNQNLNNQIYIFYTMLFAFFPNSACIFGIFRNFATSTRV